MAEQRIVDAIKKLKATTDRHEQLINVVSKLDMIKVKDGKDGEKGKDGRNGIDGIDGADGKDGERGPKGDKGDQGIKGKDGRDGRNGVDGINGLNGRDGKDGLDGKDGIDGKGAYELAVDEGFKGTLKEWLESLKADAVQPIVYRGGSNPLPPLGTVGQALVKASNRDGDYKWETISGGSSNITTDTDTNLTGVITGNGTKIGVNTTLIPDVESLKNDRTLMKEPTGFTNNDSINVSYDSTTKKITLTGDFQAYCRGVLIPELVSGWESPAITDVVPSGAYFLKRTEVGFVFDNQPFDFSCIQIAYVYYRADGTYLFAIRETHGFMPWQSHKEFHETIGTYKTSGGALSGYTPQSTVATNRRPDTSATTIVDEDLTTVNPTHDSKSYTIAYLQSSGNITSDFNNTEIVRPQTGIPNYNLFSGGVWSQAPMYVSGGAARYMSMWQYAKPVASDSGSVRYQYVWLQGQSAGDLASQESLTTQNLSFGGLSGIVPELVFINQVIIRYRGGGTSNWDIYSVKALTGNKLTQISTTAGLFLTSVEHDATMTGSGTLADPLSVVDVTTSINGLMLATDKTKLDGVATNANNYVHPDNHPPSIIAQDSSNRFVTDAEKSTWNGKQNLLVNTTNIKSVNGESLLGSGNIVVSGAVGGSTAYFLTSAFSNSTTTLSDVTEWTVPVVSGKKYKFEIIGTYQTNTTTTGGKLAIYARDSAVTTVHGALWGAISDVQVATEIKATIYTCAASNATGSFVLTTGVATINRPHAIGGQMVISCTTSGNVRFQWAGEAATAAQLNAGSVLIVTPLN